MILEEIIGSCVAFVSSLMLQTPPIFGRENGLEEGRLIYEENREEDEEYDGIIHSEYEQHEANETPHDDGSLGEPQTEKPKGWESFRRSFMANVGIYIAVLFLLNMFTVGLVVLDLNTSDICIEWVNKNVTLPSSVHTLRIVGMSVKLIPLYAWFPTFVAMLWGFREFKKYYFKRLFLCAFFTGSITCVYMVVLFDKFTNLVYTPVRTPEHLFFIISFACCACLAARKFKELNASTSYSAKRIFLTFSFVFLSYAIAAYLYTYIIIKFFRETKGNVKRAIVATLTPGIVFPLTAILKYIVLRKFTEVIPPDRAFVLCYPVRGASIVLYRTMQSGFQDLWLYVCLSLLHGVSNVLSKATLNFRIKIWTVFIKFFNRTCCGPRLDVRPLDPRRVRRLNADLETQNILFEYNTIIFSQALLTCHLVLSYEVSPWDVIKQSLIRIAISCTIDFVFNMMSVFIQIHYYDIPMHSIWVKFWRRHVIANAFMITVYISYFSTVFISIFADINYTFKLKKCTKNKVF